jgi:hypothetical protein
MPMPFALGLQECSARPEAHCVPRVIRDAPAMQAEGVVTRPARDETPSALPQSASYATICGRSSCVNRQMSDESFVWNAAPV